MKGIYALGNTGNSLPVPERQEAVLKIYAHSKLLVLFSKFTPIQSFLCFAPRQQVVWATPITTY